MIQVNLDESKNNVESVQSGLYDLARIIFDIATQYVPIFNIVLPFTVLMDIIEAVMTVINEEIKVDYRWMQWGDLLKFIKEAAEAAANPTSNKERTEAIWALLVYMTNIETKMDFEKFLEVTGDAVANMPISTAKPVRGID